MSTAITPELQRVIDDFALRPEIVDLGGRDSLEFKALETAITTTPVLINQLNQAVALHQVTQFDVNQERYAGASYDKGSINLGLSYLNGASSKPKMMNDLAFQIGHEAQHGFHAAATAQAHLQFDSETLAIAQSDAPIHDYTSPLKKILAVKAHDEASAEVPGWNALVSHIKQTDSNPSLKQIYETSRYSKDFIDEKQIQFFPNKHSVKPNINLNDDMTMDMSEPNIDGMTVNYYNQSPETAQLGKGGSSDYTNYYAASLISYIAKIENEQPDQTHKVVIDMAALKLDEKILEENGLTIKGGDGRQAYYDKTQPEVQKHFDHTAETNTYVPVTNPTPPSVSSTEQGAPTSFWDKMVMAAQNKDADGFSAAVTEHRQSEQGQAFMQRIDQLADLAKVRNQEQTQTPVNQTKDVLPAQSGSASQTQEQVQEQVQVQVQVQEQVQNHAPKLIMRH